MAADKSTRTEFLIPLEGNVEEKMLTTDTLEKKVIQMQKQSDRSSSEIARRPIKTNQVNLPKGYSVEVPSQGVNLKASLANVVEEKPSEVSPIETSEQNVQKKNTKKRTSKPKTASESNLSRTVSYRAYQVLEEAKSMRNKSSRPSERNTKREQITLRQLIVEVRQAANKYGGRIRENENTLQVAKEKALSKGEAQKKGPSMGGSGIIPI